MLGFSDRGRKWWLDSEVDRWLDKHSDMNRGIIGWMAE